MNTSNEELQSRIDFALDLLQNYYDCEHTDGKWQQPEIIDAIARRLTGCPTQERKTMRGCGISQTFTELTGEQSPAFIEFDRIRKARADEHKRRQDEYRQHQKEVVSRDSLQAKSHWWTSLFHFLREYFSM